MWNKSPVQVQCMRQGTQVVALGRPLGMALWGGFSMGDTCTHMADSCQCMAKTTIIL